MPQLTLANGLMINYTEAGTGQPLILLHTLRTELAYFDALVAELRQRYHVYAVDLPGHGQSSIPNAAYDEPFFRRALVDFITTLDLKDVTIFGESIGATIALTASTELPGRIKKIYASNPYDYGESFGGGIRRGRYGLIIGAFFPVFRQFTPEAKFLLRLVIIGGLASPSHLEPAFLNRLHQTGKRRGYRKMEYQLFKNWRSWLAAGELYARVSVPVVLFYGEHDWSRLAERQHTAARLKPIDCLTVEGAGHFAAYEAPETLAALIGKL